jgi:fumarate reductase flavoprotein subunit
MAKRFDVVIVGAGLAGLTAANRALEQGLSVCVLEKGDEDHYRCNTRYSNGAINCAFLDVNNDPAVLRAAIMERSGGHAVPALADVYSTQAAAATRWLASHGVEMVRGSTLSADHNMLAPLVQGPDPRLAWEGKGPDVAIAKLGTLFTTRGGTLLRGKRATGLVMRDGRCTGVVVAGGETFDAAAVMLADGGIQASVELLGRYIAKRPEKLQQRNSGSGTGDALKMAIAAGAKLVEMEHFYGHILAREAMHNDALWPNLTLDALVCAGIAVDAQGRRFADESLGGVFMTNAIAKLDDPLGAFAVFDHALWEDVGRQTMRPPNPLLEKLGATVHRADTIQALAERAGIARPLAATVDAYNREAVAKKKRPITSAPFYAVPLCAGVSYTLGGMLTDAQCRVVHESGQPIAGLYAAGSCTGGIDGGPAAGQNGGLGKALTFGWHAGNCIAKALGGGATR